MLLGGVVPEATTVVWPRWVRVTVYGCAVLPRKNGPGLVLKLKR